MADTPVSESYIETIEEADAMAAKRPHSSAWASALAGQKAQALQEATRRIDAMPLRGERYEDFYIENGSQKDVNSDGLTQTLEFPRVIDGETCDYDYGTQLPFVPAAVKWACLEEAIDILAQGSGGRRGLQDQEVKSFSLGKLSETFIDGAGSQPLQSAAARRYMKKYRGATIR